MADKKEKNSNLDKSFFFKFLLILIIYILLGKLGLSLAFLHPSASPIWPATGFAIAILLLLGYRFWPAIFLGAFFVNLTTEGTLLTSALIAVGNTFEGVLGAFFIIKFAQGKQVLERPKNIFIFFVITFVVSILSATVGVLTLAFSGFVSLANYDYVWLTWWLGNALGAIIILPLVIAWHNRAKYRIKVLKMLLISLTTIVISALIFTQWSPIASQHYPLGIISVLPLLWACFSLKERGVTLMIVIISTISIYGTLNGFGPFVPYSPNEALIFLQIFVGFTALLGLTISSLVRHTK